MENKAFLEQIRHLIGNNELQQALEQLRALLENSPKLDEVILQSARFQDIRQQIRLGRVSHADAQVTKNQIREGLLDLLQEMEALTAATSPQPDAAALKQELQAAISVLNSKNIVIGSKITVGGDLQIGDTTTTEINNAGANIKNQFNGGTFNNPTFS
jgi:hypothetical protein